MRVRRAPDVVIRRLPLYLRVLENIDIDKHGPSISSYELGDAAGVTPDQVRKDLSLFGEFGKQGVGYEIDTLRQELRRVLNLDCVIRVAIIGAGSLGIALARYLQGRRRAESNYHLDMVAVFDKDPAKIGLEIDGVRVLPMELLKSKVRELGVRMAVVAVPAASAQEVVDACVDAGIDGILNFAPAKLAVPSHVRLHNSDLSLELMHLAYYLCGAPGENTRTARDSQAEG
ncbi:MAG TPA: redox-sensing transcriptional repressor Rex [Firmicutes bacterium]|nr:redox-sensing transcriptional repressor Rex [Bacillota bacterium]